MMPPLRKMPHLTEGVAAAAAAAAAAVCFRTQGGELQGHTMPRSDDEGPPQDISTAAKV